MSTHERALALMYIGLFVAGAFVYIVRFTDKRWWREAAFSVVLLGLIYLLIVAIRIVVRT